MFFRFLLALLVATGFTVQAAHSQTLSLKPFKDDLFAYPAALSTGDNGAYTVLDYHEMRDINQRDEVPEKRVRAQYT
ncbi:MAG: alpha/beta hydrolase, partial [Mesorhizobium sp.]